MPLPPNADTVPVFRLRLSGLLFCASALSFLDRQVLSVLAPAITAELGMGNEDYAYVVSAFTLSYGVMYAVGGAIIDRLGTRVGMGATVLFWSAASLAHGLVRGPRALAAARFFLGVGEGGCFPGAAKGVAEWFPAKRRALGMGVAATAGSAFGAIVAPPLIVWAETLVGWRGAFLLTGALGAAWTVAWFLLYSRAPERPARPRTAHGGWRQAAGLLRDPSMRRMAAARFVFDPVFYFYMFWIPQYLHQKHGASLETIGRLTWIPFLALGIGSILAGLSEDRLIAGQWTLEQTRRRVMTGAAWATPLSVLAVLGGDPLSAILLLSVLLFAHGFWMTSFMAMFADLFDARVVAAAVGMTGAAGGLGGFLFNLAAGGVIDAYGYAPAFTACGIAYLVALGVLRPVFSELAARETSA